MRALVKLDASRDRCQAGPMTAMMRTNWPLVVLLWAAGLGAAAQYGKISVIFDQLPGVYPEAGTALGFAVSLVGAIGIALGVVAGVLVARIGYRRAILVGLWVGAAMSGFQAFFPPLPLFLAARVVEGAAHLALVVAIPTMIAQISSERDRGLSLTLWGTFFGAAFAILAWLGVPLARAQGLGALMAAHGLYLAAMALILMPLLPRLTDTPPARPRMAELLAAHARIYRSANIGAPALGWLFYTFCFVSVLTVLPPYLPETARAATMAAVPLMSIASSLTVGVGLLRVMPAVGVILVGFAASAACALALWVVPGSPPLAVALGAALGLVQGASFAAVPQLNPGLADRALANGGLAQMGNLGNTIGTPIMVAVIAGAGYGGMTLVLVAVLVLGGCVHLGLAGARRGA